MSSCYKKNVNIEKYGDPPRTPYDQLMNKVYSPQNYYAPPFPMDRTNYDVELQKKWCPNCGFGFVGDGGDTIEKYGTPPRTPYDQIMNKVYSPQNYNAAPFPMDRTDFDMELKKTWCPKCTYGFIATPSQNEKNTLNPANIYRQPVHHNKENYCGGGASGGGFANNVALSLEDNDNVWSYNARNI